MGKIAIKKLFCTVLFTLLITMVYQSNGYIKEYDDCANNENSEYFSEDCTQCFIQTDELYKGAYHNGFMDKWNSKDYDSIMYMDENPFDKIFKVREFYKNGELKIPDATNYIGFHDDIKNSDGSKGNLGTDENGRKFFEYTKGTSGNFLKLKDDYRITFEKVSDDLMHNGDKKPLMEVSYTLGYYNKAKLGKENQIHHKECVLHFPAFCGDGKLNKKNGEECDFNAKAGEEGYNKDCNTECKIEEKAKDCLKGPIDTVLHAPITEKTDGLCHDGEKVQKFNKEETGNSVVYTWGCGESLTGGECTASFEKVVEEESFPVTTCEKGSIDSLLSLPISKTTRGLCHDGVEVGDFTEKSVGQSNEYSWSCGKSEVGGDCSATYTPVTSFRTGSGPDLAKLLALIGLIAISLGILYRNKLKSVFISNKD